MEDCGLIKINYNFKFEDGGSKMINKITWAENIGHMPWRITYILVSSRYNRTLYPKNRERIKFTTIERISTDF